MYGLPNHPHDESVKAELEREFAERKILKARGRVAKMLAKKNGDMRKMPLSGREAERFLRGLK